MTVVIATRNRRHSLVNTIERLRGLPERPEILVVDNGSSDGTAGAVRRRFRGVEVLRMSRNLGAPARNVGVRAARTPYVAFSDDDSWWEPGALSRAAATFDAYPRLGLIAARTLVGATRVPDPINEAMADTPVPMNRWADLPGPPVLGFLACGSVVRREAFLQVGGFNSVLFFVGEERLLAYDLASAGWDLCYMDDIVAVHDPVLDRPENAGSRRRRAELRNTLWTAWLRRPLPGALRGTAAVLTSVPRDAASVMAMMVALAGLPWVVRERRVVPRHVEHGLRLLEEP